MSRILGIDVGTNSLGLTVRDNCVSNCPEEQVVFSSVTLFPSGVGAGKTGEAAERTKFRSQRKLYRVRRYRKWSTLKHLIEDENLKFCPLTKVELDRWAQYNKESESHREYPINSVAFQQWIKLDFNGDGKPDYNSPYELRNELATIQLDFSLEENRYKLGRALYHIAQRRGFRSSKGETIQQQETDELANNELKKSEIERSGKLDEYMKSHDCHTIGSALYQINTFQKERVRKEYPAIRKQYKDEIEYIFKFQNGLDIESDFFKKIISEKKGEGSIFYKRPLKSQKGQVGKCTLEPTKPRCPQSRPEYEEFIAWSLLNNIRYGEGCKEELTLEQKCELYNDVFVRATDFQFIKIKEWIQKKTGKKLEYYSDPKLRTINYKDNTAVPASNVSRRLKELLGDEWESWTFSPLNVTHTNAKNKEPHRVTYTWEDVWHVCFCADDEEPLKLFATKSSLNYDHIRRLWNAMPVSYANLSLKAINNINRFLKKGLLYSDACLLAKLPDIFKDEWNDDIEKTLINSLSDIISENNKERKIVNVANALIAKYKSLPDDEKQGFKDYKYSLKDYDYKEIEQFTKETFGQQTFEKLNKEEKSDVLKRVATYYQAFFNDNSRQYVKAKRVDDQIKSFLMDNFENLNAQNIEKLYHHSQIQYYKPALARRIVRDDAVINVKLLESPAIAALRNPMALRVLYTLRRKINDLLVAGIVDEDDTRVVIEIARELNDSNMRWAIKRYQEQKQKENDEYRKAIEDILDENDLNKVRMLVEQHDCGGTQDAKNKNKQERYYERHMADLLKRYRLWIEQGGFCVYTGKPINISSLLNGTEFDIEHTKPRSISFDDSMSNKTLCDSQFNRNVKGNKLPSQLKNYDEILLRIQPWIDRVEEIKGNIEYWKNKSKKAQTKDVKDQAIRQGHLWRMEYDYWQKKVEAFKITEVKSGFRNSQLVDTSIIAKYSMHFLKSVFSKVDVQKGEVTAKFRKILGIQDEGTIKKRENNSHHAIDALVLTYVPVAAARDKILKRYFEYQEAKQLQKDTSHIKSAIDAELRKLDLDINFSAVIEKIKQTVLVTNESRCKSLTIAKRRKRVRGKIVPMRDAKGKIIYEKNEDGSIRKDIYGHRIPLAKEWIQGQCIRGSLHGDTYYGAIYVDKDVIKGGKVITPKGINYVVRQELKYKTSNNDSGFKNWDELEAAIVDKALFKMMKNQFDNVTFKEACEQGIYAIKKDKDGNVIGKGEKCNRIRHIRCYASSVKNPIKIRKQTHCSKKEYKNSYYSKNGENIAYALYQNGDKRKYQCLSLFNAANISRLEAISDVTEIFPNVHELDDKFTKVFTLIPGQMVILRKEGESLKDLTQEEISCRLYRFRIIFDPNQGLLQLQHHLEARDDKELEADFSEYGKSGKNGFSQINYGKPWPRLLLSRGKQNFWIEGKDFKFVNGKVSIL